MHTLDTHGRTYHELFGEDHRTKIRLDHAGIMQKVNPPCPLNTYALRSGDRRQNCEQLLDTTPSFESSSLVRQPQQQ